MPSSDVFDNQDETYRESILPSSITTRVAIEAGVTDTWWRYVGSQGRVIGLDQFKSDEFRAFVTRPNHGNTVC